MAIVKWYPALFPILSDPVQCPRASRPPPECEFRDVHPQRRSTEPREPRRTDRGDGKTAGESPWFTQNLWGKKSKDMQWMGFWWFINYFHSIHRYAKCLIISDGFCEIVPKAWHFQKKDGRGTISDCYTRTQGFPNRSGKKKLQEFWLI